MTEKQKQFARFRLYWRCNNGAVEYGYYKKGVWHTMGAEVFATQEERARRLLSITDEELFSMYLRHRKSLKVAESR